MCTLLSSEARIGANALEAEYVVNVPQLVIRGLLSHRDLASLIDLLLVHSQSSARGPRF